MKIELMILLAVAASCLIYWKLSKRSNSNPKGNGRIPKGIYSINQSNQSSLIYFVEYDGEWLEEVMRKYNWNDFDCYDNRYFEYMYKLFDELPKQAPEGEPDKEFYSKLTRGQKIFYSMLVFGGQVDNGGVYQFFFNNPEFSLSVLESLDELKLERLKMDYEKCLKEYNTSAKLDHELS